MNYDNIRDTLGKPARDLLTGFQGVVMGCAEWLYADDRLFLKSQELKDGVPQEGVWFDASQLEIDMEAEPLVPILVGEPKVELGSIMRDRVTQIQGIAMCRHSWATGCVNYNLVRQGLDKDGKAYEDITVEEPRLSLVKEAEEPPRKKPGGPRSNDPKSPRGPQR